MNFKLMLCFIVLSLGMAMSSWAEMSFRDLKGVDEWVDHPGASPLYGFTALKTTLENRRLYGNYGLPRDGFGCLEFASRTHAQLLARKDCPRDKTSEWIQRLFPSPDGVGFVANLIQSDLVSHLTPWAIGRVLERVGLILDEDWVRISTQPDQQVHLRVQLSDLLFEAMNPEKFLEQKKREQRVLEKQVRVQAWKKFATEEDRRLQVDLEILNSVVSRLSSEGHVSASPLNPAIGKKKDFEGVVDLFLAALLESRGEQAIYPKYLPEQALLGFFIQKSEGKTDLLSLFRGMPRLLKDQKFLDDSKKQAEFIANRWTKSEFDRDLNIRDPKKAAELFMEYPELLIFVLMEDRLMAKQIPPLVQTGHATHESLGGGTYPDCGETSLRNFFNILLYEPNHANFHVEYLNEIETAHSRIHFHPALKEFYRKNRLVSDALLQSVREDWSENVVSRHPGAIYVQPRVGLAQCEIATGLDSLLALLERLLYADVPAGASGSSRFDRLDVICSDLSREGKVITWELERAQNREEARSMLDQSNFDLALIFSINGINVFSWNFTPRHFSIQGLGVENYFWNDRVGSEILKIAQEKQSHLASAQDAAGGVPLVNFGPMASYLPWFSSPVLFDALAPQLIEHSGHHSSHLATHVAAALENMIYSFPLDSLMGRLRAFKTILFSSRESLDHLMAMKPLADRLRASLSEDFNPVIQKSIFGALSDAGFPYGDPPHLVGNPNLRYERLTEEQLKIALGGGENSSRVANELAWTLGSAWVRSEQDFASKDWIWSGLIWSGPVQDASGYDLQLTWGDAFDYCLNLNPKRTRAAIRAKLDSKRRPFRGCYLPRKIEYERLAEDFQGADGTGQFLAQLPYLSNHTFWTSTPDPLDHQRALGWMGVGPATAPFDQVELFPFRCVCVPYSWPAQK